MSKNIFWIASYPKSGNTLLRLILCSLFFTNDGKSNLSHINSIPAFEKTIRLDKIKNINNEDFKKLDNLNVIYKYINLMQSKDYLNIKQDFQFMKTHSALISYLNFPFTTTDNSLGYIYILRDPRDVVISWSKHINISVQESINFLRNETALYPWKHSKKSNMPKDKHFRTLLTDWGTHVKSWTEYSFDVPKLILNYEDLVYNKDKTIIKIVNFFREKFGFKFHNLDKKIENIIKSTNFKYLKQKELEEGFAEATNGLFFREGKKNQWKNSLSNNQINLIEERFGSLMKKYGYELNKN